MDPNDPDTYKHTPSARFTFNKDLEDIFQSWNDGEPASTANDDASTVYTDGGGSQEQQDEFLLHLIECAPKNEMDLNNAILKIRRKKSTNTKKSSLLRALNRMLSNKDERLGDVSKALALKPLLIKKQSKSQSGVLVVTVLTSPFPKLQDGTKQAFTCQWDCHYCPNEPGQPRSYLHDEPSVLRANRNDFDAVLQFFDRVATLTANGHPADKIELLILGGTWHSYPAQYRLEFIRDLFYAANVFAPSLERSRANMLARGPGTVEEEKVLNETTEGCKIIGITIETRPDCITKECIVELRRLGVTRLQLGVQHTEDHVLKKVNRGHTIDDAKRALRLLKDNCYKVDVHWMPNLPGSSPKLDSAMLQRALGDSDLGCDQWKIYPTEVTPWTKIEQWYREGVYVPYGEAALLEVLIKCKSRMHPWIRLNRVIRDIPSQYILGGVNNPSMRNSVQHEMELRGFLCPCIRCREVGGESRDGKEVSPNCSPRLVLRPYLASRGEEVFISIEGESRRRSDVLFGFCRLRLPSAHSEIAVEELRGCALVRELHVYGQLAATQNAQVRGENGPSQTQHVGHGTALMRKAEEIALARGYEKIAVIAGVGSRGFYRKVGYSLHEGKGEMMIKQLVHHPLHYRRHKEEEEEQADRALQRKRRLAVLLLSLSCVLLSSLWKLASSSSSRRL